MKICIKDAQCAHGIVNIFTHFHAFINPLEYHCGDELNTSLKTSVGIEISERWSAKSTHLWYYDLYGSHIDNGLELKKIFEEKLLLVSLSLWNSTLKIK